jgi:hypothetical protein
MVASLGSAKAVRENSSSAFAVERIIRQSERRVLAGEPVRAGAKLVTLFEEHADIIVKGSRDTEYRARTSSPPSSGDRRPKVYKQYNLPMSEKGRRHASTAVPVVSST